jgi:hypothetical protein
MTMRLIGQVEDNDNKLDRAGRGGG